ncbi:fructokinase [Suicoccus acidiformans]|uniref:Fructokinase n=1 Tax=Suicoccus acidiformans TaxID=2036206 RepID=A0A347WKW6_9LACT|nr:ROK family protein [Suicoccus acidiformans]AXY25723.1 fructokinase [Suicoccus acidiformans]
MYASIEAGGTKFVCAVGNSDLEIIERVSFPTTTPEETMNHVFAFFDQYKDEIKAFGIGSFGPIDIQEDSATYGYITKTPKTHWVDFDFIGAMKKYLDVPMMWTTDVNSSVYGEAKLGAGVDLDHVLYYTVGTGFGGGSIYKGRFTQGHSHPEMGHALVRRHLDDDYAGYCPFHGDCIEGMASGVAIEDRLGVRAETLGSDHPYWEIEAYYIAQSVYNATLYLSPNIVILGGGVMKVPGLLDKVKVAFAEILNEYLQVPDLDEYIVLPKLEDDAATLGNLLMAKELATV